MNTSKPLPIIACMFVLSACSTASGNLRDDDSARMSPPDMTAEYDTLSMPSVSSDDRSPTRTTDTSADGTAARITSPTSGSTSHFPSTDDLSEAEMDAAAYDARVAVRDPWERYNRRIHRFNTVVDTHIARPIAAGYDKLVPDRVQSGISRFFDNLRLPATAANQALQGRPMPALKSLARFAVNSTLGIGGVMDPAKRWGLAGGSEEDVGQTLAVWGWRDSRYLVLPLLGPRTVRDTIAMVGDQPLSPISHVEQRSASVALLLLQGIDGRARLLPLDKTRQDAFDEYVLIRDAWTQHRTHQIEQDRRGDVD